MGNFRAGSSKCKRLVGSFAAWKDGVVIAVECFTRAYEMIDGVDMVYIQ